MRRSEKTLTYSFPWLYREFQHHFDPSVMVHFRKRFSEEELNRVNELIAAREKAMVMEAVTSLPDNDESDDPDGGTDKQISLDALVKPAGWPEDKNWVTLTIDDSCTRADITNPVDLKLHDEARKSPSRSMMICTTNTQSLAYTTPDMIIAGHELLSSM